MQFEFVERWKHAKSDLADSLLGLIANQEESLTGVRKSDVIAGFGDLILSEGCVHEQKRRMSEDLATAQKIAAEKLVNGKKTGLESAAKDNEDSKPTPPDAQQVPAAGFSKQEKEDMSVEKAKRKATDITVTPPKVTTIDTTEKKEESSDKKLRGSGKGSSSNKAGEKHEDWKVSIFVCNEKGGVLVKHTKDETGQTMSFERGPWGTSGRWTWKTQRRPR